MAYISNFQVTYKTTTYRRSRTLKSNQDQISLYVLKKKYGICTKTTKSYEEAIEGRMDYSH